ncbi:MAG: outer membrane lipoprotein carrier protein LolA [candidate division Zixibacteria bacterium]|nr:outer membrane lipoprotein carrier protein LolA [candidate division Zixibacteria bacterium]
MKKAFLASILFLTAAGGTGAATSGEWLDRLYRHYDEAERLYVRFEQKTVHAVFKKAEIWRGEFWADAGRWRLAVPGRVEVYDGAYLWVYSPSEKEVQKQKRARAQTPFRPKEILDRLKREFRGELVKQNSGSVVLRLVPKARDAAGAPVVLAFHPKSFLISSMSWEEAGDSVTVKFLRTARNLKINPKKFAFEVPAGVKVTDLSL